MMRAAVIVASLAVTTAAGLWIVTVPATLDETAFAGLGEPDAARGEAVFDAGGCASCHAAPDAGGDDRLTLAGGLAIHSDFGVFHVPNISTDMHAGIGGWTFAEFANAMKNGVSADGRHLYPSFPYTSYARMTMADINDLWGYMRTLPASGHIAPAHELGFPFGVRRAVGLWKLLYLDDGPAVILAAPSRSVRRGQYLVEAAGHCGECHTPRTAMGGPRRGEWLAGAPDPDGPGIVPNITPAGAVGGWTADDIAYYLEIGLTPDYDSVGGSMVAVQRNMARLPASDRQAIAAYLKAIPPRADGH